MINKHQLLKQKYEQEILELIDDKDDYSRSDLQGRVMAIVINIISEIKN